jgi:glutathione S-transferase
MADIVLHEFAASGNCYKIRLLLAYLGLPYTRTEYDILAGETRTPDFLAKVNANGRIPVLEIADSGNSRVMLAESNAALWYLAEGTDFLPATKLGRAQVLQWMFFEQYNHEPNVATVRYWMTYGGGLPKMSDWQKATLPLKIEQGYAALGVMEKHLATHAWFVGDACSIADIALYAYTHVAGEGGFDLDTYPHIAAWMTRHAAHEGHVKITD